MLCGNEEDGRRVAVIYTLIESCKVAGAEPVAYLTNSLTRLPSALSSRIADFTLRTRAVARTR